MSSLAVDQDFLFIFLGFKRLIICLSIDLFVACVFWVCTTSKSMFFTQVKNLSLLRVFPIFFFFLSFLLLISLSEAISKSSWTMVLKLFILVKKFLEFIIHISRKFLKRVHVCICALRICPVLLLFYPPFPMFEVIWVGLFLCLRILVPFKMWVWAFQCNFRFLAVLFNSGICIWFLCVIAVSWL